MSCCCLAFLATWLGPRVILILIWFLSDWTTRTFRTTLWPLLGFLFFPFATLFYLLSMHFHGYQRTGATTVWTIIGVLLDLSAMGGTHRQYQMPPPDSHRTWVMVQPAPVRHEAGPHGFMWLRESMA